ncbi:hypothetical protein ACNUXT_002443 [Salmonella enterica subsp. enterica serovar Saintpaul]
MAGKPRFFYRGERMKAFLQIAVIALKALVALIELILACLP